jgi:ribosome-associated heat shock protein Hsp15
MIEKGRLRINSQRCKKPGHGLLVGDILTFVQADTVRTIKVQALAERRGPASDAQSLYLDLAQAEAPPPLE